MVSVRRPQLNKSKTNSKSSIFSVRNALLVVVVYLLGSLFTSLFTATTTVSTSLQDTLQKNNADNKQLRQVPPPKPSFKRLPEVEDHHGEGPVDDEIHQHAVKAHEEPHNDNQEPDRHVDESDHHVDESDHHVDESDHHVDEPVPREVKEDTHIDNHDIDEPVVRDITDNSHVVNNNNNNNNGNSNNANNDNNNAAGSITKFGKDGPTKKGYVVDLVYERNHEPFRQAALWPHYDATADKVAKLVDGLGDDDKIEHCEEISAASRRLLQTSKCRNILGDSSTNGEFYVYNGANFSRSFCGKTIEPNQAVAMTKSQINDCKEPARLFPHPELVPITGQGMPPVKVQSQPTVHHDASDRDSLFTTIDDCDIPCQWEKDMQGTDRYIDGTTWKLYVSDADPYFTEASKLESTAHQKDYYYSTTSLSSSVPLSLYSFDLYNFRNAKALDYGTAANKVTYLLNSGCMTSGNRRHRWAQAVGDRIPLEAYGQCEHNAELGPGETLNTMEGRVALAKKNKIILTLEAGMEKDHMTEQTWEAFMSGAVPAYMGPTNANSILPTGSFIDGSAFNDFGKFGDYVKQVAETQSLWERYQKWRTDETILSKFEDRFDFTRINPQCRTCRWAYAKLYGLGWDHKHQKVTETHLPRHLCVSEQSHLVTKPFVEVWKERGVDDVAEGAKEICQKDDMQQEITIEHDTVKVVREIAHHDGIVDMLIKSVENEETQDDVVLRLEFGVRNNEGAYFRNPHKLVDTDRGAMATSIAVQDTSSKITILANWETKMWSPEQGFVEIAVLQSNESILPGEARRIRVIIEDMSTLHDKVTEYYPSSFGKKMIKDFIDPLELFYKSK